MGILFGKDAHEARVCLRWGLNVIIKSLETKHLRLKDRLGLDKGQIAGVVRYGLAYLASTPEIHWSHEYLQ